MRFNRGEGHVRVGRLLVTTCQQPPSAPWLDGGSSGLVHDDESVEHFGSLVLHRPGSARGLALGWQGARVPFPGRWRPRALYRRARWVLAGRPPTANAGVLGDAEERRQEARR